LKLRFEFGRGAAIPITLTMFDTYSTRRALMLALWFSFWAIHIVQTDAGQIRILPEVEKDEQVNDEGSTLTLTCIDDDILFEYDIDGNEIEMKWILPRYEVIKLISINYSILTVVTYNYVFSSMNMNG
jgi:hypothetical protein